MQFDCNDKGIQIVGPFRLNSLSRNSVNIGDRDIEVFLKEFQPDGFKGPKIRIMSKMAKPIPESGSSPDSMGIWELGLYIVVVPAMPGMDFIPLKVRCNPQPKDITWGLEEGDSVLTCYGSDGDCESKLDSDVVCLECLKDVDPHTYPGGAAECYKHMPEAIWVVYA